MRISSCKCLFNNEEEDLDEIDAMDNVEIYNTNDQKRNPVEVDIQITIPAPSAKISQQLLQQIKTGTIMMEKKLKTAGKCWEMSRTDFYCWKMLSLME